MEITSRSLERAFQDCLDDLVASDTNQDEQLSRQEYATFISRMGQQHRCYTPPTDALLLTVDQALTYNSLSCKACVQQGGGLPEDCCIEAPDNSLPIAGANQAPTSLSIAENANLRNICQSTYSRIEPACSTEAPSASPSAAPAQEEEQQRQENDNSQQQRTIDLADCITTLAAVDQDNNGYMSRSEYAAFIQMVGQRDYCHATSSTTELDSYQNRVFQLLACNACQSQDQQPQTCCRDELWTSRISIRAHMNIVVNLFGQHLGNTGGIATNFQVLVSSANIGNGSFKRHVVEPNLLRLAGNLRTAVCVG